MVRKIRKTNWLKRIYCSLFKCIYPEKKLPTEEYLIKMFPDDFKDPRCGAFIADTSKPCHRCGRYINEKKRKN